jgi:hypothetical protein
VTQQFTAFAFEASGSGVTTAITLPDRLAYVKNVKDFGAKGDGVTDDLAAITAALNWTSDRNKGTIYFPPGTYYVSGPINFAGPGGLNSVRWLGEMGLSVITGNFSDFIFKYPGADQSNIWEKLTIINTNATGGGFSFTSDSNNQFIRNCTITANQGIYMITGGGGPLDGGIENCTFRAPVGGVTNSYGAAISTNGPIANCRFIGLDYGLLVYGGEGAMNIVGCYFEQCKNGFAPGAYPSGGGFVADSGALFLLAGCYFKNCSTGINFTGGASSYCNIFGIRVEGTNGQFRGGNCQYGILSGGAVPTDALVAGVVVTGQYDVAAISFTGAGAFSCNFMGISAANSGAGVGWSWPSPVANYLPIITACNTVLIYDFYGLPGQTLGTANSAEGDEYNINTGTAGLTWGQKATGTGTNTGHYLVRNNSTTYSSPNFTVVGQ